MPVSISESSTACRSLKAVCSVALFLFCVVVVMASIFKKQTPISQDVHPILAFFVAWIALVWLALVEGGQASMVGLPPIDRELFKHSHAITYKICCHGHKGDNLDRYLMGRQFMVLALVFVINMAGLPKSDDALVLGLNDAVCKVFLTSGLSLILITCMFGQLNTQINAAHCMLDFIDDWGNWFTVEAALAIEASGLVHASYLIEMAVAALAGKPLESDEDPRTTFQNFLFWGRVIMSCGLLLSAFVVTIVALFEGKTTMWDGVPNIVALVLFFFLMAVVGMLEGMQIAFLAVTKLTKDERGASVWAERTCSLLFHGDGRNLPGFMVGRQLAVVACFFIIARVTTMDVQHGEENVLGVSDTVQAFFNTGILGALITTIVASIAWQLIASAFPLAYLSNPFTYILLRLCLLLEATGICQGAWVMASVHRELAGFRVDEVYVGTADERAAIKRGDKKVKSRVGLSAGGALVGAKHGLVVSQQQGMGGSNFIERRIPILKNIKTLQEQLDHAETEEQKEIFEAALRVEKAALRNISREEGAFRRMTSKCPIASVDLTEDMVELP